MKISKIDLKKDEEDIMNLESKSSIKAKMSCGHSISSEGITSFLEYCLNLKKPEIKCPASSLNP